MFEVAQDYLAQLISLMPAILAYTLLFSAIGDLLFRRW